jgi:ubiquitin-activating enzyme E1 C
MFISFLSEYPIHVTMNPLQQSDLAYLTTREGPLAHPEFDPATAELRLAQCRTLVVGAGGLGCELLKDLALSGFKQIDVIDMDTIDISNLNRQFLFRESDVGKSKAECAARFVMQRVPGVKVTPHFCRIEDYAEDFYAQFQIVICGLDAIEPRRWLNNMLVSLVQFDAAGQPLPHTVIPMVDGGTEGWLGNARVVIPFQTACFECTLHLFPQAQNFPICTLKNTPRLPEHCIEYVTLILWDEQHKGEKLDGDDPNHVKWVFERATERARQFSIDGVTLRLTQGVIKRIIPAIASTNAVIAAACANEAVKIVSKISFPMDNYTLYSGEEGVYTYTYANERSSECMVCSQPLRQMTVSASLLLREVIERLKVQYRLSHPGLRAASTNSTLYLPALDEQTRANLDVPIAQLISSGEYVACSDESVPFVFYVQVILDAATPMM